MPSPVAVEWTKVYAPRRRPLQAVDLMDEQIRPAQRRRGDRFKACNTGASSILSATLVKQTRPTIALVPSFTSEAYYCYEPRKHDE
jgi:hypothetical protein